MALIRCPECGAQISDAAKQCVHCGCVFRVCPECGKVHAGEPETCGDCGYSFQKKAEPETPVQDAPADSVMAKDNYIAMWESSSSFRKGRRKFQKIAAIALELLTFVFILAAVWVVISWKNGDQLEALVKAGDTLSSVKVFVALACICILFAMVDGTLWSTYEEISLGNWLAERRIDPIGGIRKYYETVTDEEVINGSTLTTAAYLRAVPAAKTREYVMLALLSACAAGFVISLGICAVQNVEYYMMRTAMYSETFRFQFAALIPAAIFIVAYAVIFFAGYRAIGKKENEWLEKVAPGLNDIIAEKMIDILDRS